MSNYSDLYLVFVVPEEGDPIVYEAMLKEEEAKRVRVALQTEEILFSHVVRARLGVTELQTNETFWRKYGNRIRPDFSL